MKRTKVASVARVNAPVNPRLVHTDALNSERVPVPREHPASVPNWRVDDVELKCKPAFSVVGQGADALDELYGLAVGRLERERAARGGGAIRARCRRGCFSEPRSVKEGTHDAGNMGDGGTDEGGSAGLIEISARGADAGQRAIPATADGARLQLANGDGGGDGEQSGRCQQRCREDGGVHGA